MALTAAEVAVQERRRRQARSRGVTDGHEPVVERLRNGARIIRELYEPYRDVAGNDIPADWWAKYAAAMDLYTLGQKTLRTVLDYAGCCCEGPREDAVVVCDACAEERMQLPMVA